MKSLDFYCSFKNIYAGKSLKMQKKTQFNIQRDMQ